MLETDAGVMVSEISAIAEYLEEIAPAPPIIGSSPEERAQTRMWARRLDLEICMALGTAFQAGRARRFFADRKLLPCEQAAEDYLAIGAARLGWLEERMGANRWVCGERFSWADVPLFAFLEFFGTRGRQEEHYPHDGWLDGWRARMRERPSVAAALALAPAPAAPPGG